MKKSSNGKRAQQKYQAMCATEISSNMRNRSGTKLEDNMKCPTNQQKNETTNWNNVQP